MKLKNLLPFIVIIFISTTVKAQKAEKQISFAQENKPHSYYVEQAKLWSLELQKDSSSEENWFNYFRACRNAQGTANWKTDFVKESPYLKAGGDIVKLMEQYIPGTFTYYYLSYLNEGIGLNNGENLLRAYEINPGFEGIHSSVVSYAVSSLNRSLRKKVNNDWYKTNYLSPQLLAYGYNVLMSLEKNAILVTQNDNDTYPLWMLQDVMGLREDVEVVNVDFMLLDNYRADVFTTAGVPPLEILDSTKKVDDYELNWFKITQHILANYEHKRPMYLNMSLFQSLYKGYENQLSVSGLVFKYGKSKEKLDTLNKKLYEEVFCMDFLKHTLYYDRYQANMNYENLNYMSLFTTVYELYIKEGRKDDAEEIKQLAVKLAEKTGNEEIVEAVKKEFKI